MRLRITPILIALLTLPGTAGAQAPTWNVLLTARGDDVTLTPLNGLDPAEPLAVGRQDTATLRVTCAGNLDCARIRAQVVTSDKEGNLFPALDLDQVAPARESVRFRVAGESILQGATAGPTTLRLLRPGTDRPLRVFTLENAARDEGTAELDEQSTGDGEGEATLAELLARNCRRFLRIPPGSPYNREADMAQFLVTPRGAVLTGPAFGNNKHGEAIDENDYVLVHVLADERLLPLLNVLRTSDARDVEALVLLGAGTSLGSLGLDLQSTDGARQEPRCDTWPFVARDFAPGTGVIEIRALNEDASETTTGRIEFVVNRLYWGAFSLGPMRTELEDHTYGVAFNGTDSVLTVRSNGDYRIRYALMVTPFIWGRRDTQKAPRELWHHINPSLGIAIDDVPKSVVGGLTVDVMTGVFFTYGIHAERVSRLDPNANLRIGQPYSGPATGIPLRDTWAMKPFTSLTIDVRAAVELLRTALTAAGGGGG